MNHRIMHLFASAVEESLIDPLPAEDVWPEVESPENHKDFWQETEFGEVCIPCGQCRNEGAEEKNLVAVTLFRRHCRDDYVYYVHSCLVCGGEDILYMTVSPVANNMFSLRRAELKHLGRTIIELDNEVILDEVIHRARKNGSIGLNEILSVVNDDEPEQKAPRNRWGLI